MSTPTTGTNPPPAAPAQPPAPTPPPTPTPPPPAEPPADKGFPEHTPVAEMTAPQQAAYWREQSKVQQRRAEAFGNLTREELDELRNKAGEFDKVAAASQTDQQRAVAEAEQRTRAAVLRDVAGKLVDANITAAVAGRVPAEQLAQTLAPLDRTWFLTESGDVDPEKVAAYAAQLAGATPPPPAPRTAPPNHGAGFRTGTAPSGAELGREMARRRGFLVDKP